MFVFAFLQLLKPPILIGPTEPIVIKADDEIAAMSDETHSFPALLASSFI